MDYASAFAVIGASMMFIGLNVLYRRLRRHSERTKTTLLDTDVSDLRGQMDIMRKSRTALPLLMAGLGFIVMGISIQAMHGIGPF